MTPHSAAKPARVGIVGAGLSGMMLAAVLARRLGPSGVHVTVLERGARDRDQGYGIDLGADGQLLLARAGVLDRFWQFSQPRSDTWAFYGARMDTPALRIFRPRLLARLLPRHFHADPETNRGALREVLLSALASSPGRHEALFQVPVSGVYESRSAEGKPTARLTASDGSLMGEFDLVVDASGLFSPLRQSRVDDPAGVHFAGSALVHGYARDVAHLAPTLRRRLANNGSTLAMWRGRGLFFQRYGAGAEDRRVCFFYQVNKLADEDALFRSIGYERPRSRASGTLNPSDPRWAMLTAWMKRDMGPTPDDTWRNAVDGLDELTVRNNYTHGDAVSLRPMGSLPLVCVGDALWHVGLGGGGHSALADVRSLSELLVRRPETLFAGGPGGVRAALGPDLEQAEVAMLKNKAEWRSKRMNRWVDTDAVVGGDSGLLWDSFPAQPWYVQAGMKSFGYLSKAWYSLDRQFVGEIGCDPIRTPLHPEALRESMQSK